MDLRHQMDKIKKTSIKILRIWTENEQIHENYKENLRFLNKNKMENLVFQLSSCYNTEATGVGGLNLRPRDPSQLHQLCMELREGASGRKLARWAEPWQEEDLCGERVSEPLPEV